MQRKNIIAISLYELKQKTSKSKNPAPPGCKKASRLAQRGFVAFTPFTHPPEGG
jgi:hypothetical protein